MTVEKKPSIMEFAGFLSKKESKKVKKAVREYREESAKFDAKRKKRLEKLWSS